MKNLLALILASACMMNAQNPTGGFGLHKQKFVVRLLSPLNTKTARAGDGFTASVEQPTTFQGATVDGRITNLIRPQRGLGKGKAQIQFQFERVSFGGRSEAIKADLKQVENSQGVKRVDEEGRVIGVTSNKKRILAAVLMTGVGAAAGGVAGGVKGAGIGAASGLGAGLIVGLTMTTSGSDIEFRPGSIFTLTVSDSRPR